MPKRNTDRLPLKGDVPVFVCRQSVALSTNASCEAVGKLQLAPVADGVFTEILPAGLIGGAPRTLTYFVELKNRRGRSAGQSNPAVVLTGEAPASITGLAAEVRKDGIVLHWNAADPGASVRIRRKLLTPAQPKPRSGPLSPPAEPMDENLMVDASPGAAPTRAIDRDVVLGNSYEYRAERVVRESVEGSIVELEGELSAPIRVDALDVFPPAVPVGLVAVGMSADAASGTPGSIDLSWQPNSEADLAGYEVYRREDQAPWQRVSGEQPVVGPAFHDAHVLPGHTYRYGVSAIDKAGHESGRSAEASETLPNQ